MSLTTSALRRAIRVITTPNHINGTGVRPTHIRYDKWMGLMTISRGQTDDGEGLFAYYIRFNVVYLTCVPLPTDRESCPRVQGLETRLYSNIVMKRATS
jgi:hypothetical protein